MIRRTMLFLPGNNPNMLINGDILGADSVILDLEDAVAPDQKDAARDLVKNAIGRMGYKKCEVIVRINALDTPFWQKDLDEIMPCKPDLIMPTKVSGRDYIETLSEYMWKWEKELGLEQNAIKVMPLLETTLGIENAFEIGKCDRVMALYLGAEDLTADLRCKRTKEGTEIFYARSRLVMAARASEVAAYDTPFTDVEDLEGLRKDALLAKGLGYTGKAVISPRHVACVNEVFSPTKAEIDYAKEVFEAIELAKEQGKGAISLRGKMVDAPIVERARQVLEAAEAIQGGAKK